MENLSIKNLHMNFSGVRAFDGGTFTVKECEIFSDLITLNSNHKSSCVKSNIIN